METRERERIIQLHQPQQQQQALDEIEIEGMMTMDRDTNCQPSIAK